MNDLLGGAIRGKTRPRGFVDWKPQAATLALLDQVQGVLDEYADYLPLTVRQVFYRLVGAHGYDKTEKAYERLCEALNRARRARADRYGRDPGRRRHSGRSALLGGRRSVLRDYREAARNFRLDRQEGQPTRLAALMRSGWHGPAVGSGGQRLRLAGNLVRWLRERH